MSYISVLCPYTGSDCHLIHTFASSWMTLSKIKHQPWPWKTQFLHWIWSEILAEWQWSCAGLRVNGRTKVRQFFMRRGGENWSCWFCSPSFSFSTAGHFMQRGDSGKRPHFEICRRDEMEIQGQSAVCVFVWHWCSHRRMTPTLLP